jgi:hypothetical protein
VSLDLECLSISLLATLLKTELAAFCNLLTTIKFGVVLGYRKIGMDARFWPMFSELWFMVICKKVILA